jgi:nitrilase
MTTVIAAVQATPVFLDRDATTDKACTLIKEAGANGAALVVFPETFIPAYPDWVWRVPAWGDGRFTRRLCDEAVTIPGPVTDRLGEAARQSHAYVAVGVNELDGSTLYNTLLYLAPDGSVVGRHRKLMPTGGERTIWGYGDGSTLDVVSTPFGIVGGLICWENYMPLARAAMYARGVDIYLAPTWDKFRYLGGDAASHRQRGPRLRGRGISRAAWQRRTRRPTRRRLRRGRRLDESRSRHDRRTGRGHPRRSAA